MLAYISLQMQNPDIFTNHEMPFSLTVKFDNRIPHNIRPVLAHDRVRQDIIFSRVRHHHHRLIKLYRWNRLFSSSFIRKLRRSNMNVIHYSYSLYVIARQSQLRLNSESGRDLGRYLLHNGRKARTINDILEVLTGQARSIPPIGSIFKHTHTPLHNQTGNKKPRKSLNLRGISYLYIT